MSARSYVDVFCDICGNWAHGDSTQKRAARKNVVKRGFVYVKLNGELVDLCPMCALENGFEPHKDSEIEQPGMPPGYYVSLEDFKRVYAKKPVGV